ncbi:ATP-binding protein [Phenylobacterium montanum]|uniref:histidine kinase n=1 Tax=Phenylobacterium montanum TaxID=2823693 RepID=A0A975IWE4_9CAUL|nr:ATP-binding protein [Caulobacter sp. S6]QUD89987.1 response regulator [Caulobacter sp. S6]
MTSSESIRFRVQAVLGLLVIALVTICAFSAEHAFERRQQARRVMALTEVSRDLFTAMNALRLERGATDGLLHTPGEPTAEDIDYKVQMRRRATAELDKALPKLRAITPGGDPYGESEIARRLAQVVTLRDQADAAISLPPNQRPKGLPEQWFNGATALTGAITETTERLAAEVGRTDPFIAEMMNIGQLAWSARAEAGTDSLLWGRASIVDKPLTPEQRDQFSALVGQVDIQWSDLMADALHKQAPPGVMAAIRKAEQIYFGQDRGMRTEILNALIAGKHSPVTPAQQRALNTPGLESLMGVASAAFDEATARAGQQADAAQRQLYAALGVMLVAIAFGLGANLFIGAQVLQPIGRITAAMRSVAEGELETEIPDTARRDEVGELARALSVFRANAVAKQRMNEELLQSRIAEETAEASSRAKAEFLANMSHEIRTPLTSVIGFAGLLAKTPELPEKARVYISRIITGGKALHALVNDILDFSRIEAGQIELEPLPLALEPFLSETLDLERPEAEAKGLALRLEMAETAPEELVVDGVRLRQVLMNLVGNAIKFTAEGSVTLSVSRPGPGKVLFKVVDTGSGVAAEHGERLFQRFSQVDASNTRRHGGAGLGLAISKGLVELMGGEIGLHSESGKGSIFWFSLPEPKASRGREVEPGAESGVRLGQLRVLVVDDVATNRELVTAMLSPYAASLREASNGAEAVAAAQRDRFDVILMDLQMPVMDGMAAARAIRRSPLNADTPILAVSANVMTPQVMACADAGMNDHIGKPIDPAELLSKIGRWTTQAAA